MRNLEPTIDGNQLSIAVMAYRRPQHLERTLAALEASDGFENCFVHIFVDGSRDSSDARPISDCVHVAEDFRSRVVCRCEEVKITCRDKNYGLSHSIISATSELCDRYGHAVILEDDLLVAPSFLNYMRVGLTRFREQNEVIQISAHSHDRVKNGASFAQLTTSWGWGTWASRWQKFLSAKESGDTLRMPKRSERKRFNFGNAYPYDLLLRLQRRGCIDSWAIEWHNFAFQHEFCTLFPPQSLIENIGFDGTGEHCRPRAGQNGAGSLTDVDLPLSAHLSDSRQESIRSSLRGRFGWQYLRRRVSMNWKLFRSRYLK